MHVIRCHGCGRMLAAAAAQDHHAKQLPACAAEKFKCNPCQGKKAPKAAEPK